MMAMLSGRGRILFVGIALLFWLIAGTFMAECAFRLFIGGRSIAAAVHDYAYSTLKRHLAHDNGIFQKVSAAHRPPATVFWGIPMDAEFEDRDETGRLAFAEASRSLILLCDRKGHIITSYPCGTTPELALLSDIADACDTITDLLPPAEAADAVAALGMARSGNRVVRDYYVPLSDGSSHAIEFRALPLKRQRGAYAVFIGDSVYESMYRAYRPHIYRRDWWWRHQYLHSEFWTNALGFRDKEIVLPKPKGVVRIACIGGSTTVEGPHNELTYPRMLEVMLREKLGSDKIEVINCGVDAVAFHTEYNRMTDFLALEPDLIIHYNIINNLRAWISDAIDESGMLNGRIGRARIVGSRFRLLTASRPEWFLPSDAAFSDQLGEAMDYLDKINRAALDGGASLAVASFATPVAAALPWYERVYFDNSFHAELIARATTADYNRFIGVYNRMAQAFCEANDVLYIPVAENFAGGVDTFTDICHMRLRGIELKARIMAEHLEDFVRERLAENHFAGEDS